jgi:hypothetical protein
MKPAVAGASSILAILIGLQSVACRRAAPGVAPSTRVAVVTAPATLPTVQSYHNHKFGVSLTYPSDWKAKPSKDYELLIIPASGQSECFIVLDVPDLPTHIPGFIPISMVYDGYLSDLKKQCSNVQATVTTPSIPDAHARLATCTGIRNGRDFVEHALLLVHGDHVYIVQADGSPDADAMLGSVFNSICKSLQWK